MSEEKVISVETISAAIEEAAKEYGAALETWYPQHGDNAPAERNLTLHFAFALKRSVPGTRVYAESSLVQTSSEHESEKSSERIDLVAYEQVSKSLVVVEAKRFLEKSPGGLVHDVKRIARFVPRNNNHEIEVQQRFGVLLTQTTEPANASWWKAVARADTGGVWSGLAKHLASVQTQGGICESECVHTWDSGERHVLWCVWPCPLT